MNERTGKAIDALARFWSVKSRRRLIFLAALCVFAVAEFIIGGLARRTFVFYDIDSGAVTVEDRMLKRSRFREVNIRRYVEEVLLGPVSPDSAPLFPRGTTLTSLLYRDGVVYAGFSDDAALAPQGALPPGGTVWGNFQTLYGGIRRNFSFVEDVRFFVGGEAAFTDEFRVTEKNEI